MVLSFFLDSIIIDNYLKILSVVVIQSVVFYKSLRNSDRLSTKSVDNFVCSLMMNVYNLPSIESGYILSAQFSLQCFFYQI